MAERLKGKVAVVTGAGRGIGRGEALALASEGARVVINDLGGDTHGESGSRSPADEVVKEIKDLGGEAVANHDSVATASGGEAIIQTAIDAFGRIDILVNNAGILRDKMVFNMAEEDWDIIVKVHLYGHFFTSKHACQHFRSQRSGRIINTSSVAGLGETFGQTNYGAAKEGIVGLTRQLAADMGRYGVTCNAIRPTAATRLVLNDELIEAYKKAGRMDEVERGLKMKAEDVAPMVIWLASEEAAHVNGRTFYVETGTIALYSEPIKERMILKDINKGGFTIDEIFSTVPDTICRDLVNPFPPKEAKK